ncbi:MAG: Lipoprotein-releasing system transmembrane protein LolE [Flavobacterium sp. SCGC AAA160-P02]|nr:MAG: Lipoprotein-releasing system transmembrane protein LolE [Flavobacterium sp. SCGC AAA160-P02]
MNFPFYIAKRYLFAKRENTAINIITIIASAGVIVGTAALFIILSGFSGLRTFNYSLLDISDPDIKITASKGKSFLYNDSLKYSMSNNEDIAAFAKVTEERVVLKNGDKQQVAYVKGVDYNYIDVVKLDDAINLGTWLQKEYTNTSVIGNRLAYKISMGVGSFEESLQIIAPKKGAFFLNPAQSFRSIKTQVVGAYFGTEDFENKYVFVSNAQAQQLLNYKENQFTGIEIKLKPGVDAENFSERMQKQLGNYYKVRTKAQLNELFYKVINTENFISYLIFTLIVIIALFNVVGSIIMIIIDKKNNLKTMLSLGATLSEVRRIFVLQGFLLTLISMIIGMILSLLIVVVQQQFQLFMITSSIPYPLEIRFSNILVVVATISLLGFIASMVASSRISLNFIEK